MPCCGWDELLRGRFCLGGGVLDWLEEVSLCRSGGEAGGEGCGRRRPGLVAWRLLDRVLSVCRYCAAVDEERMGSVARLVLVVVRWVGSKFELFVGWSSVCVPVLAGWLEEWSAAGFPAVRVPF